MYGGGTFFLDTVVVVCDAAEPGDTKTTPTGPAVGRSAAIKGILKTTPTTTTSELPETATSKTQNVVAATSSPDTKRRGILKKQLSFETDDPTAAVSRLPGPPPPPPPLTESTPQRPRTPTTSAPAAGDQPEDHQDGAATTARTTTTPKIKNKAIARRLMLRDRHSVDDETMTSFPGDGR